MMGPGPAAPPYTSVQDGCRSAHHQIVISALVGDHTSDTDYRPEVGMDQ